MTQIWLNFTAATEQKQVKRKCETLTALEASPKSIFSRPMALMIAMMDWIVLL
jgi:hypothetical protein